MANHIQAVTTTVSLSPPIALKLYTLPYWCKPPFSIFDIRTLWRSGLSARASECQKLKMVIYTSMALMLNPLNSSNLEQLAFKGLKSKSQQTCNVFHEWNTFSDTVCTLIYQLTCRLTAADFDLFRFLVDCCEFFCTANPQLYIHNNRTSGVWA